VNQTYCPPNANACYSPRHEGEKNEKDGVTLDIIQNARVVFSVGFILRQRQEQPATNSEVGDEDMNDGDDSNKHAATDYRHFPEWVIHPFRLLSALYFATATIVNATLRGF
jgi:hypothetical protein